MNKNNFSLTLRLHVIKLCKLTYKTYPADAIRTKISLKMLLYFPHKGIPVFSTFMSP